MLGRVAVVVRECRRSPERPILLPEREWPLVRASPRGRPSLQVGASGGAASRCGARRQPRGAETKKRPCVNRTGAEAAGPMRGRGRIRGSLNRPAAAASRARTGRASPSSPGLGGGEYQRDHAAHGVARSSRDPYTSPIAGFAGVLGTLVTSTRPVAPSTATMSVNVPPVSMPMRSRGVMRTVRI
jgi:hypothetical protein